MIRIFSIILLGFVISSSIHSEQHLSVTHFPFREHTANLSYHVVYEDPQSLIWLGTNQGLFQFDGVSFKGFEPEVTNSKIPDVRSIIMDLSGRVWVGCVSGQIYHLDNKKLHLWDIEEGHPTKPIIGFVEQKEQMWIATYGEGVYYWEQGRLYNMNTDDGLSSNDIYSIIEGPEGEIWVATDAGIDIISASKENKSIRHLGRENGLADEIVLTLHLEKGKSVLFGYFDEGVGMYQVDKQSVHNYNDFGKRTSIQKICYVDERFIWMNEEEGGVMLLDRETGVYKMFYLEGFTQTKVNDLVWGAEGNLWILDEKNGLYSALSMFSYHHKDLKNVQAVSILSKEVLVIGTEKGAFMDVIQSSGKEMVPMFQNEKNVISLHVDQFDQLWIGTFGEGVFIKNPNSSQLFSLSQKDGIVENSILDITELGNSIFLSTLGGVTEIQNEAPKNSSQPWKVRNYDSKDGFGTNYIYNGLEGSGEKVWFATDGKGLCVLEGSKIRSFTDLGNIPIKSVHSLAIDGSERIWVSTAQNRIFYLENEHFYPFEIWNQYHLNEEVLSIINDEQGKIFIVGAGGLHAVHADFQSLTTYQNYGLERAFEPALNSAYLDDDGFIWIGGKNGVVRFDPHFSKIEYDVRIFLSDVRIFDQVIPEPDGSVFDYQDTYLSIDFVGLWYTNPSKIRYRYRVEGLDQNWKYTSESSASFYHLPPGNYKFVAQASLNEYFYQPATTSFSFKMLAPFWRRPLFFVLSAAGLISLIFWFVKWREDKLKQESERKKKMLEAQFQTLKSQINPHFLFNSFNTLASTIEENPEAAVEYVEHLSDFYRSILQYREKNVIPLEDEIVMVKNYMYLLKKRFGDQVSLNVKLNGKSKHIAPLSLQLLVENAVKHNVISKSKPLHIDIMVDPNDFITISNNLQKKRSLKDSTHYGLTSLVERYKLLSEQPVQIIQTKERFTVKIPSIKKVEL